MTVISFSVPGIPAPAGSTRAIPFRRRDGRLGVSVMPASTRLRDWQATVRIAARQAAGDQRLLTGPLRVGLLFTLPRPKSHYGKRGLRPAAPPYPAGHPDLDKLTRAVLDALTGVIFGDDAQVVSLAAEKVYGEAGQCMVIVMRHK